MNEKEFREEYKEFEHLFNIVEAPECVKHWNENCKEDCVVFHWC